MIFEDFWNSNKYLLNIDKDVCEQIWNAAVDSFGTENSKFDNWWAYHSKHKNWAGNAEQVARWAWFFQQQAILELELTIEDIAKALDIDSNSINRWDLKTIILDKIANR